MIINHVLKVKWWLSLRFPKGSYQFLGGRSWQVIIGATLLLRICTVPAIFFFIYFLWNYRWLTRRRQWHPTPVLLPGKSHGQRSLVGCSPWGHEESDTTEWLHFHFHGMEKEMATDSSVLAWRIPKTGKPGGLPSLGLHRVRHDWSNLAAAAPVI